jgi:hypothetical protein
MNALMRRLGAAALALLLVLPYPFAVAQVPLNKRGKVFIRYGLEPEKRMPSEVIRRTLTEIPHALRSVRRIRRSPYLFKQAGGVMFDAVGQPCAGLAGAQLRLSYNRAKPDGRRLTLHGGAKAYTVPGIYDRDLSPIAAFAGSTMPILTNVQTPDEAMRQSCPLPGDLKLVTLHPAFLNTELGRHLTSIDSVPWSFSEGRRWDSVEPLPPATLRLSESLKSALEEDMLEYYRAWPSLKVEYINAGTSVLRSLDADQIKHYTAVVEKRNRENYDWQSLETRILSSPDVNKAALNKLSDDQRRLLLLFVDSLWRTRVSNFNDDEVPPSFCTEASSVTLDGGLQLQFIAPKYSANHVLPASSGLMTENISQLRLVDEGGYDAMMKIYRLGGLFRYVKQQSPSRWKQFLRSLPPKEKKDTYTIICPDCAEEKVEAWLACVERKYPPAN